MGKFIKGDVVVVPFPFSDLTANKKRPALVVASLIGDDVILCQITSKMVSDTYAIPLTDTDFTTGTLHQESNIRPNRSFTADSHIILRKAGTLTPEKLKEVVAKIMEMIRV
jgi:mRNA interferase MazF